MSTKFQKNIRYKVSTSCEFGSTLHDLQKILLQIRFYLYALKYANIMYLMYLVLYFFLFVASRALKDIIYFNNKKNDKKVIKG